MESWMENFARANFRRSSDTAHDLKTPLNVAVLNLELMRMRLRKLTGDEDEKITGYTRALEAELRRMGRIFDAFFLLSTPPKNEGEPQLVDAGAIAAEAAAAHDLTVENGGPALIRAHESRIRQAYKLFFEGATHVLTGERRVTVSRDGGAFDVEVEGLPDTAELELTRIFKFYYSDPSGNPDLTLATARLVAETYGGELNAVEERGKVLLRMSFPLGAK
jgi:signal transduction histidine kinase